MLDIIILVIESLITIICVLISVAFFTVVERKTLSGMQGRVGPNQVAIFGLLQAISDGVKLILKGFILPDGSDKIQFIIGPIISFSIGILIWGFMPIFGISLLNSSISLIIVLAISSIGIHGVLLGGYSSNSKYAYYGAIRSSAQMISYEVSLAFLIGGIVLLNGGTFSFFEFNTGWLSIGSWPILFLWLISILAETNRHPFDLPEAESELVSGYNVEYSGGSFALYFLGEYASILFMSFLTSILFFKGNLITFCLLILFYIWARGAWPRCRFDQLMYLGWWTILPISISILIFIISITI